MAPFRKQRADDTGQAQNDGSEPQQHRALMGVFRRVAMGPQERLQRDGEADGEHQRIADDRDDEEEDRPAVGKAEGGIDLLLGEEAEKRRQPAHRDRRHQCRGEGHRHRGPQAAEPADVARPGLVVDRAGDHEQRALEHRMRDQVEHRRLDRLLRAEAGEHHQKAQRGDRRVGEHQLEVGLADRQQCAGQKRRAAEQWQDRLPRRRLAHHRVQAHHQIDAGLHHGGRVQVGGDRRRRLHGVRQPEVKRHLRRFRERAAEHENEGGEIERAVAKHAAARHQRRQFGLSGRHPGDQQAGQQRQPAEAGDDQCLKGGAARRLATVIEADQQERGDRGQFPEDEQHQERVRDDQPLHRTHEHQDEREEPALVLVPLQVAPGIEDDQRADSGDQQRESQRKTVEKPRKPDTEARNPVISGGNGAVFSDGFEESGEVEEYPGRGQSQHPGGIVFQVTREKRRRRRGDERKKERKKCERLPRRLHSPQLSPFVLAPACLLAVK